MTRIGGRVNNGFLLQDRTPPSTAFLRYLQRSMAELGNIRASLIEIGALVKGDSLTLGLAVLAATVFALFSRPFSDYHYWWTWSRTALTVGVLLYFLVAGVGGGVLGWLAGVASHARVTSWPAVNGIVFGLGGALAIRAELGQPKSRKEEGIPQQLAPALTLLNIGTVWTFDMVDRLVSRSIEQWLESLTDADLRSTGLRVATKVSQLSNVPDPAKESMMASLITPMEKLKSAADDNQRDESRIGLRGYALSLFQQYRWPRP